ncbi:TPA: hypothetical protein MFN42_001455 [Klebsiella quasipneumoniae subsp. quasipneumoniae]|nr:hypothetical protein [Klebsiella quasipneumoniae subsp. quasipneumoniae]
MFYKKQISIKKEPDGPSTLGQLKSNPFINKDMLTRGSVQTFCVVRGQRPTAPRHRIRITTRKPGRYV